MDYKEAKEYAIKHNIKSAQEWFKHAKEFKIYPHHPERAFKNDWCSWYEFLSKDTELRKYSVNDDFFKNENNNMAYILGFWAADGFLDIRRGFSITQHKSDEYLLSKILKTMDSNHNLLKHGNNRAFLIKSKEIFNDLTRIFNYDGKNKTYNINFPKFNNNELYSDFIRGFFDGDGCVTYQKNEKCYVSSIICVNYSFLQNLLEKLKELIVDFGGKIHKYSNYYYLTMGVNDTRRFRNFIYNNINIDDHLFLIRKKEKLFNAGDIKIATFNKSFLNYDESKLFVKTIGIKKYKEWKKYKKDNKIDNIPSNMEYYKEYTSWYDFIN
jgi:hypothetical protein